MNWPNFDFDKHSYKGQLNVKKLNCGSENNRPKACRSLLEDFRDSSSKKRVATRSETVTESAETCCCQVSPTAPKTDPSQIDNEENSRQILLLSPVMINGFLRNQAVSSSLLSKNFGGDTTATSTMSRFADPSHVVLPNDLPDENSTTKSSSNSAHTSPCAKKLFLSNRSPVFRLRSSRTFFVSHAFSNHSKSKNCLEEYSTCLKMDSNRNETEANQNVNFIKSLSPQAEGSAASPKSTQSCDSSTTIPETLPPSQIYHENLYEDCSEESERSFAIGAEIQESERSAYTKHVGSARNESDVLKNCYECAIESENTPTSSEQSDESSFSITVNETEPDDAPNEEKNNQNVSQIVNQSTTDDFWETATEETIIKKQQHRLSRLAEALKKRMLMSFSNIVMWKYERPRQQVARQVVLVSSIEQWGSFWTVVKDTTDSALINILDSEPLKTIDICSADGNSQEKKLSEDVGNKVSSETASPPSNCSTMGPAFYNLYQPVFKLASCLGEVILAPRYYR